MKIMKILKQMVIPDHLTCVLRNLYKDQGAIVRTGHAATDGFQIMKGSDTCLFNLYAEYIMRNDGLNEAQAAIKIAGRNINHFRYADDTTLIQKSKKN